MYPLVASDVLVESFEEGLLISKVVNQPGYKHRLVLAETDAAVRHSSLSMQCACMPHARVGGGKGWWVGEDLCCGMRTPSTQCTNKWLDRKKTCLSVLSVISRILLFDAAL
eukprot:1152791-Pelagomonas_calceolata.AAC.10